MNPSGSPSHNFSSLIPLFNLYASKTYSFLLFFDSNFIQGKYLFARQISIYPNDSKSSLLFDHNLHLHLKMNMPMNQKIIPNL